MRVDAIRAAIRRELGHEAERRRRLPAAMLALAATLALGSGRAAGAACEVNPDILRGLTGFNVGSAATPAPADLDGDGDLDIVSGGASGSFAYLENTGSAAAPAFQPRTGTANPLDGFTTAAGTYVSVGDLDSDGDLDVMAGDQNGVFHYFENTGTSATPAFLQRTGTANPFDGLDVGASSTPAFADLDGDGDLDVVTGESTGELNFLRNTGSSTAPAFVNVLGTGNPFQGFMAPSNSRPAATDLDGDLDLDVAVGRSLSGSLHYLRNTGSSTAPAYVEVAFTASPFNGVLVPSSAVTGLGDLDDDGDLDLLLGAGTGRIRLWTNTGNATNAAFLVATGEADPLQGVAGTSHSRATFADLDDDGDPDAVVSAGSPLLLYVENTGSPGSPAWVERTGSENPFFPLSPFAPDVDLADLDGDGDLDLSTAGYYGGTPFYYENTGTPASPAWVKLTGSASPYFGLPGQSGESLEPTLVDLDADGDLDLVGAFGPIRYYRNTGTSTAPAFVAVTGTANPLSGVFGLFLSFADLDGDDDLELLSGDGATARLYENTGTPVTPAFLELTGSANPYLATAANTYAPTFADLDEDGDLDLVVGDGSAGLRYFRSDCARFRDGFESGDTGAWSLTVP
ncbi:MAG TPA: FG-GAP-like repeat-containing protein [Thermoanaerobaculia bacterium]|nr:FG-GAP-like repeat-containing protein [Thermoanaerobaculia bacterium]